MSLTLNLLPLPQHTRLESGTSTLPETGRISLHVPRPAELLFTAQRAQQMLQRHAGVVTWEIAGGTLPADLTLTLDEAFHHPQGYRLLVTAEGIQIGGADLAGIFYGVMTLSQLIQTHGRTLPRLVIEDWPDFPARGVIFDISRDKVPTMETLYHLVDLLAGWKINQFQLYTEHTFAYRNHRDVWEHASPMTAEQVLLLDAYCRERYIDLVPNQNSFGHMHRWFKHARYLPLAETETEFTSIWGSILPPFSLSPAVPGGLDLLTELYEELLPNFSSRLFNVGCDETIDLGLGRSKTLVEQYGKGRVYLNFLLEIYHRVQAHGHTMMFWGDIINQYPDLVPEVPKNVTAMEWGYEADHDFPGKAKLFADAAIPFYVCPGTSSWLTLAGRTDNCMENIRSAVENGLKHGAIGVLNTDWGDRGHWQTLPISTLGLAYGAALNWAFAQNTAIDLPTALSTFAFEDPAGVMGRLAYDLGNAYQQPGILLHNSSLLYAFYETSLDDLRRRLADHLTPESLAVLNDDQALKNVLHSTLEHIDGVMQPLHGAQMAIPDADLVRREYTLAAWMMRHGVKRALFQLPGGESSGTALAAELDEMVQEYRAVWLARNRPGGLDDSAGRLNRARTLYR